MMGGDILSLGNHCLNFLLHNPPDHAQLSPKPKIQNKGKEQFASTSEDHQGFLSALPEGSWYNNK
jgi:hypothetical protein